MGKEMLNEGMWYVAVGVIFFVMTMEPVYPAIVFIIKALFYILGGLFVFGGVATIVKYAKKGGNGV